MTSRSLDGLTIVGGMAPWRGKAPFHRAPVVLALGTSPATYLKVSRYDRDHNTDSATGELLSLEEWRGLLAAGEALEFTEPVPAGRGLWLWVLRDNLVPRLCDALDDIRTRNCAIHGPLFGEGGVAACLVDESRAEVLREVWADRATARFDQAWSEGDVELALQSATAAYQLEANTSPRRLAMLIAAYRRVGRDLRADGLLQMATNIGGAALSQQVLVALNSLTDRESTSSHPSAKASAGSSRLKAQMRQDRRSMHERAA